MNNFIFDNNPARTSGTSDRPLFVEKDVCSALGIENHRDTLAKSIPEDEKGVERIYSLGGPQEMAVVTEPGLYRLMFRSDKPEAKRFQDWVFKEVLPQLRQMARFEWLKGAFNQAKTGKVQPMILQDLGIGAEQRGRNELALKGFSLSQPFDIGLFWAAVEQGFAAKPTPNAFRLSRRMDGWLLKLLPQTTLELARLAANAWRGISRAELRARLEQQPEWITGEHRHRIGGKQYTYFAVSVTKNSPTGLLKLIERLEAGGQVSTPSNPATLEVDLFEGKPNI